MSHLSRPGKLSVLLLLVMLLTAACQTASVPGIDSAIDVSGGALRVSAATRTNSIGEGATQATVRTGYDLILVSASLGGSFIPLDSPLTVVDTGGNRYRIGGLYQGQVIYEVPETAQGLVLWYGSEAQVPLYGLLGEAAPAAIAATPTARPTLVVSATPPPDAPPAATPARIPSPTPGLAVPPSDTPVLEEAFESAYEVQPGDTLFMIADMFGVSIGDLLALNNLTDDSLLEVGQILILPPMPTPIATPSGPTATPVIPAVGLFDGSLTGLGASGIYTGHVSFQVTRDGIVRNAILSLPLDGTSTCRVTLQDLEIDDGEFFLLGSDMSITGRFLSDSRADITVSVRSCNGSAGSYPLYTGRATLQTP